MDDSFRAPIRAMLNASELFRDIYGEATVVHLSVLLFVGLNGPVSQAEMALRLGISTSALSRAVATLSDLPQGLGLVTIASSLEDRRVKHIALSPKGQTVVRRMSI